MQLDLEAMVSHALSHTCEGQSGCRFDALFLQSLPGHIPLGALSPHSLPYRGDEAFDRVTDYGEDNVVVFPECNGGIGGSLQRRLQCKVVHTGLNIRLLIMYCRGIVPFSQLR